MCHKCVINDPKERPKCVINWSEMSPKSFQNVSKKVSKKCPKSVQNSSKSDVQKAFRRRPKCVRNWSKTAPTDNKVIKSPLKPETSPPPRSTNPPKRSPPPFETHLDLINHSNISHPPPRLQGGERERRVNIIKQTTTKKMAQIIS